MSWTCERCLLHLNDYQESHSCIDPTISDFLAGKSEAALIIFNTFLSTYQEIGHVHFYAGKSMIILKNKKTFAQVIYFGKNFIDIVFQFQECFHDNYCFRKIVKVPGTEDYNHHVRLMLTDDINDELLHYMRKAYRLGEDL